jgi:hypothetical protein
VRVQQVGAGDWRVAVTEDIGHRLAVAGRVARIVLLERRLDTSYICHLSKCGPRRRSILRVNIRALAAILRDLLAGVRPFLGDTLDETSAKVLLEPQPSIRELRPEVSEGWRQLSESALSGKAM